MSRTAGWGRAVLVFALAAGCTGTGPFNPRQGARDVRDDAGGGAVGPADAGGASAVAGSDGGPGPLPGWDAGSVFSNIRSLRIEPENAVLQITPEKGATQEYRVLARMDGRNGEVDVTDNAVFYVSSNHHLGSFPGNDPVFESNADGLRGGHATVTARVSNVDGDIVNARTGLILHLAATLADPRDGVSADLPDAPSDRFEGDPAPDRAPGVVYPNDGVLLPPNLNQLDVHFRPGLGNTLFEVTFDSMTALLRYYVRCGEPENDGCVLEVGGTGYRMLADSNRGSRPIAVTVRGTNDAGDWLSASEPISIQFTDTDINGGLYYWTTSSNTAIMRFDFGVEGGEPEVFLAPDQDGMGETCIGCHAISPDGKKVLASLGGQGDGRLVYINDLTVPKTDDAFLDRNGTGTGSDPDADPYDDRSDRLQFASFNPDGSQFVAVYGDTAEPERHTLWFHDGETGVRIPGAEVLLDFEPDHPDWSSDGRMIAVSRVGTHGTSQRPANCGISLLSREGDGWGEALDVIPVVVGDGKTRYNPDFVPDSSFFVFSESTCDTPDNETGPECNADVDPSAKTWAAVPEERAAAVFLARASAPGIADGDTTDLTDTFPRSAPFEGRYLGEEQAPDGSTGLRRAFWITIASTRRVGLRNDDGHQQLWMFAVDRDRILKGEDGSFAAFHLPFQDPATRNHIAQWTEAIVSDDPPPEPPEPPPPPEPPEPPPPE